MRYSTLVISLMMVTLLWGCSPEEGSNSENPPQVQNLQEVTAPPSLSLTDPPPAALSGDFEVPTSHLNEEGTRFRVNLREFSESILEGYAQCSDLESDLEEAARLLVNLAIEEQSRYFEEAPIVAFDSNIGFDDFVSSDALEVVTITTPAFASLTASTDSQANALADTRSTTESVFKATTEAADSNESATAQSNTNDGGASEEGFQTNNQERGVDEADIVKSDGEFVYLAYGNELVIHDLHGEEIQRLRLSASNNLPSIFFHQDILSTLKAQYEELLEEQFGNLKATEVEVLSSEGSSGTLTSPISNGDEDSESRGVLDFLESEALITNEVFENRRNLKFLESEAFITDEIVSAAAQISENVVSLLLRERQLVVISSGYYYGGETFVKHFTRLSVFDVSDAGELSLKEEQMIKGSYQSAREVDGRIHVVTLSNFSPQALVHPLKWRLQSQLKRYVENQEELEVLYPQTAIRIAEQLIPLWREALMQELFGDANGVIDPKACEHVVQVNSMRQTEEGAEDEGENEEEIDLTEGQGVLNSFAQITSFDLESGLSTSHRSGAFVPTSQLITYANQSQIVLGGQGWSRFRALQWDPSTFLMAFTLNNAEALPQAVGSVEGRMLNQFSMDFHDGHLRVASTTEQQWSRSGNGVWEIGTPSESRVTILRPEGNQLQEVGLVEGLGRGERIFAVRFLDDRGFVVTFRQIDPFYTLDLSDPENPQVVGELKIPGFSNYLHPVGDNHILAVGQDANEFGRAQGLQVTLFDVSDLANPIQQHKYVVPGWSSSQAQFEHKAFRYLASQKLLILPLQYEQIQQFATQFHVQQHQHFNGFHLLHVSPEQGIEKVGEIQHSPSYYWGSYVSPRSLAFESLDQLITIKDKSIKSHQLSTLAHQWDIQLAPEHSSGCGECCFDDCFFIDPIFIDIEPAVVDIDIAESDLR